MFQGQEPGAVMSLSKVPPSHESEAVISYEEILKRNCREGHEIENGEDIKYEKEEETDLMYNIFLNVMKPGIHTSERTL
jgi:hypothetical protein